VTDSAEQGGQPVDTDSAQEAAREAGRMDTTADFPAASRTARTATQTFPDDRAATGDHAQASPDRQRRTGQASAGSPVRSRRDGFPLWPEAGAAPPTTPVTETVAPPPADLSWPTPQMRPGRPALVLPDEDAKPRRHAKLPRPPGLGLPLLIVFALLGTFFAWVSADPFWVAVGHAERGTATITRCSGSGLTASCVGAFKGDRISSARVRLNGVPAGDRKAGAKVSARMVSAKSRIAYAGPVGPLNVRWLLGLALVLLCGLGIGWATGAGRLLGQRTRLAAYGLSVAAPVALLLGMLVATF
jgi:hypothetical protein